MTGSCDSGERLIMVRVELTIFLIVSWSGRQTSKNTTVLLPSFLNTSIYKKSRLFDGESPGTAYIPVCAPPPPTPRLSPPTCPILFVMSFFRPPIFLQKKKRHPP